MWGLGGRLELSGASHGQLTAPPCFALDFCQETTLFPKFILVSSTVGLLTVFLVSLFLWKLQR